MLVMGFLSRALALHQDFVLPLESPLPMGKQVEKHWGPASMANSSGSPPRSRQRAAVMPPTAHHPNTAQRLLRPPWPLSQPTAWPWLPGLLSSARTAARCITLAPPPRGRSPSAPNLAASPGALHQPAPASRGELGRRLPCLPENTQRFVLFPGPRPCRSRALSQFLVSSTSCWCSPETEREHPPRRLPCQLLPACKDLLQRDGVDGFSSAWKGLLWAHIQLHPLQVR